MKKLLLFLTVFFFFGFVIAEEVQVGEYTIEDVTITLFEEREPEPKPEPEPEKEQRKEAAEKTEKGDPAHDISGEPDKEPEKFFFQAAAGVLTGINFNLAANFDFGFLVFHSPAGHNLYLGFETDFRYAMKNWMVDSYDDYDICEIPFQAHLTVDFKNKNPFVPYLSMWFSIGAEVLLENEADSPYDTKKFKGARAAAAWGTGLNLVLKNSIVFKTGIEGYQGKYPVLLFALGYRF
ncbi:hypothetical protein IKS86_03100 [bacterium]|nr:hypothetical protein [bacterium]